jgi:hypothetical protein
VKVNTLKDKDVKLNALNNIKLKALNKDVKLNILNNVNLKHSRKN